MVIIVTDKLQLQAIYNWAEKVENYSLTPQGLQFSEQNF